MSVSLTLTDIRRTIKRNGGPALKLARKRLLQYDDDSYSSQALRHLSKVTLHNALPVFPALVSMANEAVCGDSEKAISFGQLNPFDRFAPTT